MTTARLSPVVAAAIRAELVTRVAASHPRSNWRAPTSRLRSRRWLLRGGAAALLVAIAGTAYALTTVLPGGTEVRGLAPASTSEHTGSATIELGPRPQGVTAVQVKFECLSAGTFSFPNGSRAVCDAADVQPPASTGSMQDRYDLQPGQHTLVVTADPQASWRMTTRYVSTKDIPWAVNAKGETYGISNAQGDPVLMAVVASNGRQGYAYTRDLDQAAGPQPTDPAQAVERMKAPLVTIQVPVYESDGETVIGQFPMQSHGTTSTP